MPERLHDFVKNAADAAPERLAIIGEDGRRFLWRDMWRATLEARDCLEAADVRPGDRVVLVLENCPEIVAFFFATTMMDAAAVAVNARMTEGELARIIAHSDPSAIVFSTAVPGPAQVHAEQIGTVEVTGAFGKVHLAQRAGSLPEATHVSAHEQVALLLYTSGTTGTPKAAMLTHTNMIAGAKASADMRGMSDGDMTYLALPLSHIFGLVTLCAVCFAQGSLRLEARFTAQRLYEALMRDVTLLPAVPQMHAHLFHYARANGMPKYDKGLLRYVSSGGAPLDPAWKREAEAFYGLPLQNGYGLTECAAGVCATRSEIADPDVSVGVAMQGSTLALEFDAPGADREAGIGEVLVRGPQVMKGFFFEWYGAHGDLHASPARRSADLGRIDDQGRLHIVGRSVEGKEEVLAFVKTTPDSGLTEEGLRTHLEARLAPYKRPSHIVIAFELPAAPTGKILKSQLISHFSELLPG